MSSLVYFICDSKNILLNKYIDLMPFDFQRMQNYNFNFICFTFCSLLERKYNSYRENQLFKMIGVFSI